MDNGPAGYTLGVDLGTTYTAAAIWREGRAQVVELGLRTSTVPSVVLLREDETMLTGEAASRRAMSQPDRVAREFKRRVGDTTPLLLGGTPMSAEALMARLLRAVVDSVTEREGGPPSRVAVSHPANWGPYKTDLLRQGVRLAGLEGAELLTEPEAAAIHYAAQARVDPGSTIAVYDLGGGTFDAAVLRKTAEGWQSLGQPEGIERLGGIDFDAAVFGHVQRALGGQLETLDIDDPAVIADLGRLRDECVAAKEALSVDDEATIAVALPGIRMEVTLTRDEFERMIRPALADSLEALRRALESAGVEAADLAAVLLVGGSSRIPLVARLVGEALGRPVAIDVHPKHAVALGAALAAVRATPATATPIEAGQATVLTPRLEPVVGAPRAAAAVVPPALAPDDGPLTIDLTHAAAGVAAGGDEPPSSTAGRRRVLAVALAAFVAMALVAGVVALMGGDDDPGDDGAADPADDSGESDDTTLGRQATVCDPDHQICITEVSYDGEAIVAPFETNKYLALGGHGADPPEGSYHVHWYLGPHGATADNAGVQAEEGARGRWQEWATYGVFAPSYADSAYGEAGFTQDMIGDNSQLCAVVANERHEALSDSAYCADLPDR